MSKLGARMEMPRMPALAVHQLKKASPPKPINLPLPPPLQLAGEGAAAVLPWVVMNGAGNGRTTMSVFLCSVSYRLFIHSLQKEVERRRRGNINEGINELGRIVPSGSGEKAKGAILSRAVQYIHHLKENEARNIEKWTLEKLLMDQAMGDLQAQLEEIKRLWEEERMARGRLESEIEVLRNMNGVSGGKDESASAGTKRRSADATDTTAEAGAAEAERDGKRQRTE
jgi:hypothetical protein